MKQIFQLDPWKIVEDQYRPEYQKIAESVFSQGNARMGGRGHFEEYYSGPSLIGNYVGGIYYPDKTRVGWWKNGYPQYYAKVLNAANWSAIDIYVNGERFDIHQSKVHHFKRTLHMDDGYLERSCTCELPSGAIIEIHAIRFLSMAWDECGACQYTITALQDATQIRIQSILDYDIRNEDANYQEDFWESVESYNTSNLLYIHAQTKITAFQVCVGFETKFFLNGKLIEDGLIHERHSRKALHENSFVLQQGDSITIEKSMVQVSSLDYSALEIASVCLEKINSWKHISFEQKLSDQSNSWYNIWKTADIKIGGDISAQQGIRFNIYQLFCTYTGKDPRLNIGPKGFTGEKYGGCTYWDTEAYCIPFYLGTAAPEVSRNLLMYRYHQLNKAIINAQMLGFDHGAALYPMVTMNGEECHNEWEITFEEIHRNGAIVYAIYDYIKYTGDEDYLWNYGIDVITAINRFWVQRLHFSNPKNKYVMHGVTGPNEYENNVNNNWYTLYLAQWCLNYGHDVLQKLADHQPEQFEHVKRRIHLDDAEMYSWRSVAHQIYLPENKELNIFLQQEDYLEKDLQPIVSIPKSQIPLHQHWSWDRILRSCYIKQADVLQGIYFFEDDFTMDQIKSNFDFYEPMTVHESSLSPCVHAIIATKLGYMEKAEELYLRTSRLDLDDYNHDTCDGLHITSMAGTWMSVIKGFGGIRIVNHQIVINPRLPKHWKDLIFSMRFKGSILHINIQKELCTLTNQGSQDISINIKNTSIMLHAREQKSIPYA